MEKNHLKKKQIYIETMNQNKEKYGTSSSVFPQIMW